ncbi:MAG: hypothetical protein J5999_04285 [Oscillospiraceae bacterium]|nr:hypothetical protein [Oscillospiraceae bacterium]
MKKHFALCLALAAVISLSACSASEKTSDTTTEAVQEQTTAAETTKETESADAETTAEETTAETEAEEKVVPNISEYRRFRNGSWLICVGSDQYYMYNMAAKKCYKLNENLPNPYGIEDIYGDLVYYNDKNSIYNAETGEKLFDTEDDSNMIIYPVYNDNLNLVFTGDKIYLAKQDSSFSGSGNYEIGCMGNDGEWIVPMTSDSELFNSGYFDGFYTNTLCPDYIGYGYNNKSYFYDIVNNRNFGVDSFKGYFSKFVHADGSDFCYFYVEGKGLLRYDIKNDCIVDTIPEGEVYETYTRILDNGFIVCNPLDKSNYKWTVINPATDVRTTFDLTKYEQAEVHMFTDDCVLAECRNNGNYYVGVFDKNGEPLFEPIKGKIGENDCKGTDEFIVCNSININFFYNTKTGELTMGNTDKSSSDYFAFTDFDVSTNTLLVHAKNPEDGKEYFYLADANDPTNLYNPLAQ